MFCPRCGRAINETANFCGGCGLSKAEIEKFAQQNTVAPSAAETSAQAENAETVYTQSAATETAKADDTVYTQPSETAYTQDTEAPETEAAPVYTRVDAEAPKAEAVPPVYCYGSSTAATANSTPAAKNENLTTVDFIWMFIISAIPVVGLIYLIWLAVQNNNTNKRSFARASLIISLFSVLITAVFIIGFVIAGLV